MFWRFGGYANISTIDTILEKPDFTVEDLLDEGDLIQEIKQQNSKLIEYLREDKILAKLLEYVVAPKLEPVAAPDNDAPDDDDKGKSRLLPFGRPRASSKATSENDDDEIEKKRNRYAYVAAEVLASDTWSIYEALMENKQLIRDFWQFLERPSPLDPLQASYFTKVNESLFDKKTEDMIDLLKNLPDAVPNLLKHVECPMIMDLLLKIIALDRTEGGQGIVEWLYARDVIPTLLSCLSPDRNWVVQTAAGDFIKAIITISANASQNEQQCIGPNELTRQLVSKPCVEQLIEYMLTGGNPLTVGVGIVIEVIRKNNSDYDPDVGTEAGSSPSSRDPIYLGTLLRLFAENVPKFMSLIMNAPSPKKSISSTFGDTLEPLGFDRFKTCELMAELLHCSNMGLLNEVGSEELIANRDAERHRLRREGKLLPQKNDEGSQPADDLEMRLHPVPDEPPRRVEDGRRLEVTNVAEEDGFEQVEPSREMNEDTSHEFVKAEEEIAAPPAQSFLDKDDDDFVDEPLSSPRLNVKDVDLEEPRFDEPDLMVAPLSPRKAKAAPPVVTTDLPAPDPPQSSKEAKTEASEKPADDSTSATTAPTAQEDDKSDSSVVYTPTTSEAATHPEAEAKTAESSVTPLPSSDAKEAERNEKDREDDKEKTEGGQEPELIPEAPEPPPSSATEPPKFKMDTQTPSEETPTPVPAAPPAPAPEVGDGDAEPGVESIIIKKVESRGEDTTAPITPVVGDFLKMQFVEYRVVPTILSFFFRYPWNNFLHNVVYDIVQQVFNGPMDRGYNPTLAVSLFEAADITTAIIQGQVASDESQAKTKTRMGYMGHLTLIAEEVVKFTERHPPELLSETVLQRVMSQDWMNYVEGALAETRERDNAILGGVRPDVAMNNRPGMSGGGLAGVGLSGLGPSLNLNSGQGAGSSALAEAGLNGGLDVQEGGNGIGPFAISAGTMMSGFGSSSDEDEDEGEDNEEDVTNEFRAYTDPLNNNNNDSSMSPPSIPPPPPPPPPNPPSRARLQLAARLAMHQKNNAAAAAAAAGGSGGGLSETSGSYENGALSRLDDEKGDDGEPSPLRNPFGDDADEIDSDDADEDEGAEGMAGTGGWGAPGRGSWWRGVVMKSGSGGRAGKDNSDDEVDDEDDEEFGDFAMPEVDTKGPGPNVIKPLAVHPPAAGGAQGQKSGFGSLWPFGNASGSTEEKAGSEAADKTSTEAGDAAGAENPGVSRTVEAKKRTSLDDPEDEVVV